jgi:hypothetical protein
MMALNSGRCAVRELLTRKMAAPAAVARASSTVVAMAGGGEAGKGRALISVFDKEGLPELAKGLEALGYEVVSTGGSAKAVEAAGVAVSQVRS